MDIEVSRVFDYALTIIGTGDRVHSVWHGGKTPLNGGGANGVPKGTYIGRVWDRCNDGDFYAAQDHGEDWVDLTWYGPFKTRIEACIFLVGKASH